MNPETLLSQKTLRASLYSGMALIIVSMLFLGREVETSPFLLQVGLAILTPALFYITGGLVYRYLDAPLAAPGIVATGAWLVVIELVHFYDRRAQLPDFARDYYWLLASLLAAGIVTRTAYRARLWLLVPLVPLTHINALWATMSATGLGIAWWPVFSFLLVLAWWELPLSDQEWRRVYRVSAVLLEVFLLIFSYWLPAQTDHSMVITWGACALLVAVLALRHGWVNLGPLALVLLACAAAWGLPLTGWPPAWLLIGIGTVVFIERLARRDPHQNALALELSTALAVLLCGLAALLAKGMPFFGASMAPLPEVLCLAASGSLMIWIGQRRALDTAQHAGLWLLAAAWGDLYFALFETSRVFGLWLSLLAVIALLTERLLFSANRTKRKVTYSVREVVAGWPLADLVVGLSAIIVIWTGIAALDLPATDPVVVASTLAVVIGVWLVAGLLYRMPVLVHVALWLAPLPYALILILTVPPLRRLPFLGLAWQVLAISYLMVGHLLSRYRPVMLVPFFAAGYLLLGLGLTLTLANAMLLIAALTLIVVVCFATSLIVISGGHPAWDALVARIAPPDARPYAYTHIRNAFVFLTAWLLAIWLILMLGAAGFSPARQGIVLVLLSSAWIVLGRLLPRLPGMVGWPVYAAGWFMWLTGLLLVFFSPPEAIITAIFGLALSAEVLYRSKAIHWMPVFILQILFSALQVAWMLDLSGYSLLLAVTMGLCVAGMEYERRNPQAGRITALTGGVLSLGIWIVHANPVSTLGLALLVLAALVRYRRWEFLLALEATAALVALMCGVLAYWRLLLAIGALHWVIGSALVVTLRPRRFRTFTTLIFEEYDWASPLLWTGSVCITAAITRGWMIRPVDLVEPLAALAVVLAGCTLLLRVPRLPYVPVALGIGLFAHHVMQLGNLNYTQAGTPIARYAAVTALAALGCLGFGRRALHCHRPFSAVRGLVWWVRPALLASGFLAFTSFCMMILSALYRPDPAWFVANCLLLSTICLLQFWARGYLRWAGAALALIWMAWTFLLFQMGLHGWQWHTIPLGLILLILARTTARLEPGMTEQAAVGLLLYGGLADLHTRGLLSPAALIAVLQVIGLIAYGYREQRRAPFVIPLAAAGIGAIWVVGRINPWLIPLGLGLGLLAGTVLLEGERARVADWIGFWQQRFPTSAPRR